MPDEKKAAGEKPQAAEMKSDTDLEKVASDAQEEDSGGDYATDERAAQDAIRAIAGLEESAPKGEEPAKGEARGEAEDGWSIDIESLPEEFRALAADFTAPKGPPPAKDDLAEILALIGEAPPKPEATPAKKADGAYGVELPEGFSELEPFFKDFVNEFAEKLTAANNRIEQLTQELGERGRKDNARTLKEEFATLAATYKNIDALAPRVEKILERAPQLAMSFAGLNEAFDKADKELKLIQAVAELKGARKGGPNPRPKSGRSATTGISSGAEIKTTRDAARAAARYMLQQGMQLPEELG